MENNKFEKKEITLDSRCSNLKSFLFILPIITVFLLLYQLFWNPDFVKELYKIIIEDFLVTFIFLLLGIVLHELIHGFFWALFIKKGFRSIKFGIMISSFTPYCHCKEPIKLTPYIVGSIMPAVLLGLVPLFISLVMGNFSLLIFGVVLSIGAGSDFLMIWKLRKVNKSSWVLDHPDKIGCFIYQNSEGME